MEKPEATKYTGESNSDVTSLSSDVRVNDKALIRKIDIRVVPVLCLLYTLAFLDR